MDQIFIHDRSQHICEHVFAENPRSIVNNNHRKLDNFKSNELKERIVLFKIAITKVDIYPIDDWI